MQLGTAFTIAFYLIAAAALAGIFGLGVFVYRQERRMTWQDRLRRAERPWEERQSPGLFYGIGGMWLLFGAAFIAVFLGGAFRPFLGLGIGYAVFGILNLYRGRHIAKRRRAS